MENTPRSPTACSNVMEGEDWVSLANEWLVTDDNNNKTINGEGEDIDKFVFEEIDMKSELSFERLIESDADICNNIVNDYDEHKLNNISNKLNVNCNDCELNSTMVSNMAISFETRLENEINRVKKCWKIERKVRKMMYDRLERENKALRSQISQMQHTHSNIIKTNEIESKPIVPTTAATSVSENTSVTVNATATATAKTVTASVNATGRDSSQMDSTTSNSKNTINNNNNNVGITKSNSKQAGNAVTKLFSVFKPKSARNSISNENGNIKSVKNAKEGCGINTNDNDDLYLSQEFDRMENAISEIVKECKKTNDSLKGKGSQYLECQLSMNKIDSLGNVLNDELNAIRSHLVKNNNVESTI